MVERPKHIFASALKDAAHYVLKRQPLRLLWRVRWWFRTAIGFKARPREGSVEFHLESLPIVYINLNKRTDRRREIEDQFRKLGIAHSRRFAAVEAENGGLGCAMSHLECLTDAERKGYPAVLVCEDDVDFTFTADALAALIGEFLSDPRLDVLCLGFAAIEKPVSVSASLSICNNIQTTSCYVAKGRAIPALARAARLSADSLAAGKSYSRYAYDQTWKRLQRGNLFFAIPKTHVAHQRESFSDIEKRWVAYKA